MHLKLPNLKNVEWSLDLGPNDVRIYARTDVNGQELGVSTTINRCAYEQMRCADELGKHITRSLTQDLIEATGRAHLGLPIN